VGDLLLVLAVLAALVVGPGSTAQEAASAGAPLPSVDPTLLTDGVWVGAMPVGMPVFRLRLVDGRLVGESVMVRDGKAVSEGTVVDGSMEVAEAAGEAPAGQADAPPVLVRRVTLHLLPGWTYRARLDATATHLAGELEMGGGRRMALDLEKRPAASVPGLAALPPAPAGEPVWTYRRPEETGDGWRTADAAEVGLDPARLQALVADVAAGEAGLLHSLLLVRDDRLVLEAYFHGFGGDDLHNVHSCTKSVASLLVGLAIADGDLAGVDTPWLVLFPEIADTAAPGWDAVRLRHVLTMTSGADWAGGPPPAGLDLVRAVAARPPRTTPGTEFRYTDVGADLLAPVLLRATGEQADVFAAERVFAPLGIESWDWEGGKLNGFPRLYSNLMLRPRDLAKLGELVLDDGRWQGRQVVPEDWIGESTRQQVVAGEREGYGYLWWREPAPPSLPAGVVAARGVGSQIVYAAPDLRLVVAVTGGNYYNRKDFAIGDLLLRHLLPAVEPEGEQAPAKPSAAGDG
jgi:CubicO group peptidase (beta-lactamase class C family)